MKVAVITGCNRGVGYGVLKSLLKDGYLVYGLNRTPLGEKLERYFDVSCDISDPDAVKKACSKKKVLICLF